MTSIRQPPRPPPSKPLPSLPVAKTRSQNVSDDRPRPSGTGLPTPRSPSKPTPRSATASALPTPKSNKSQSASSVPTVNTTFPTPQKPESPAAQTPRTSLPSLRKVSSIGAFPLPPSKSTPRISSLPPSPLSTSESYSDLHSAAQSASKKQKTENKSRPSDSGTLKRTRTPRSSGYGLRARASAGAASNHTVAPSLLNGSGENSFISSAEGARGSDGFLSLPSPPQSQSSSVDESYNTDDTIFEDLELEPTVRGRKKSMDSKRSSGTAKDSSKGNVIVSVRVRPDAGGGDARSDEGEWMVDGRRSLISYRGKEGGDHVYDNVFSPHDGNARVYENAAKRLVRRVMEGYNGTVFAYGMTGTGKTFSMQGTANQPGTIPLAITDIFSYIRENPDREFLLRVSYLEIYNEKIFDLLNASTPGNTQQEEIKLREDSKRGVYASPLKEEIVQSPNQLLRVISRGDQARRTGSTQFNARSSRSHAVVQIVVESRERVGGYETHPKRSDKVLPGGVLVSTLSLIDLAGSEKAAANKERRTEGGHINKSLLTLGTVIARLSGDDEKEDGAKPADKEKSLKHLPYRDSKLTRLLQPALSGDSLVSILCTIQLSSAATSAASTGAHTGETLNTLKFASRAKNNIVSHAKRNESNTSGDPNSRALLDRYRLEIQELRAQLEAQNKAKAEAEEDEELKQDRKKEEELERQERTRHEEQMLEMQLARTALKERIGHLNRLILSSKSLGVNSSGRFSSASMPVHRMSSMSQMSQPDFGRPVSLRSRDSLYSRHESQIESYRDSPRTSTNTLEVPNTGENSLKRTFSTGSITTGVMPVAQVSQLAEESEDEDDTGGPRGDGEASLVRQNNMLQADLADKNRYIATLEKRLWQARRTSHSRTSMSHANRVILEPTEEHTAEDAVREKDREIESLRAKLDDQTRMVQALRSATRKRETLDNAQKPALADASTQTTTPSETPTLAAPIPHLPLAPRSRSRQTSPSHRSTPSTASASSTSHRRQQQRTLSPVALLSPSRSADGPATDASRAASARLHGATRRRSVDEMTALLDQMIADKVESGHMVRGERGSLRAKRDTVMEKLGLGVAMGEAEGGAERE